MNKCYLYALYFILCVVKADIFYTDPQYGIYQNAQHPAANGFDSFVGTSNVANNLHTSSFNQRDYNVIPHAGDVIYSGGLGSEDAYAKSFTKVGILSNDHCTCYGIMPCTCTTW